MSTLLHKVQGKIHKATDHTSPEGHHLAAIQQEKGGPLVIEDRPTPRPGPGEYLVEVHAVALNPVDHVVRDTGLFITEWPAVFGVDAAGVILEAGPDVPSTAPAVGTRVVGYCPTLFHGGGQNYGAFQKKVLLPYQYVAVVPEYLGFEDACKLSLSVVTAWNAWHVFGLPNRVVYTKDDKKGVLVWGGSGSVGSAAVQVARLMGYYVYTTSGHHNHMFVTSLGATRVFDYTKENAVEEIIAGIKEDGVTLDLIIDAAGALPQCNEIARATGATKIASAVPVNEQSAKVEGVDTKFIMSPTDERERGEWFQFVLGQWLTTVMDDKFYRPSPQTKLVKALAPTKGGLKSIDDALDELKGGVSGVKLVLEI